MKTLTGLLLLLAFCASCGQKGDLYYPQDDNQESTEAINEDSTND